MKKISPEIMSDVIFRGKYSTRWKSKMEKYFHTDEEMQIQRNNKKYLILTGYMINNPAMNYFFCYICYHNIFLCYSFCVVFPLLRITGNYLVCDCCVF